MTPIGHSLAGYAVYNFSSLASTNHNRLKLAFLCIFMANSPDLDFLPGILMGRPELYHHGITHSFGFALIASLLIAAVVSIRIKPFSRIFNLCLISYLSHIIIDFFGSSNPYRHPPGMPLFWPISREGFSSPVELYLAVHYERLLSTSTIEWLKSVLRLYNVGAIMHEVVLILPFIFLGQLYKRRYRREQPT